MWASASRIESFDGQHFDNWTGDTGSFGFTTSAHYHGRAALDSGVTGTNQVIDAFGTLGHHLERGQVARYAFNPVNGDEACRLYFLAEDINNSYYLALDPNGDDIRLRKIDGGSDDPLTSIIPCAWTTGDYNEIEIDLTDTVTDTIAFEVFDSAGTSIATGSATDATQKTGGCRVLHNGLSAASQSRWDHFRITQF